MLQQLSYHYPSYNKFISEIDGKAALLFWHKYPSPKSLEGVSVEELAKVLRKASHNTLSTKKAAEILEWVGYDGNNIRNYQEQRDFLIQSHVRDLRFKQIDIDRVMKEIRGIKRELGYQLESMDGIDTVIAASLVAEIGDIYPSIVLG
ncbi:hypothetical protein [Gorillibacterium sp. sgz5001074]|uniref:hypothetical protein n=1 Tax=Gorillibacterium sp. sgz5001074 TaxID=3446695 RepID=UPI003F679BD4